MPPDETPETRHYHGSTWHDHPGGERPHDHPPPPGRYEWLIGLAIILAVGYAMLRVWGNLESQNTPPGACQLLGGTWNIWDGWRCG